MPEYRNTGENVSPASLVLPLVRRISPASAFRHRPQSGTADHGLVRWCPAMDTVVIWFKENIHGLFRVYLLEPWFQ
jgi:hypothetical protein